jgi:hypothetical protein
MNMTADIRNGADPEERGGLIGQVEAVLEGEDDLVSGLLKKCFRGDKNFF